MTPVHPDIAAEVEKAWMDGKPFTQIRPLQEGVDDSEGAVCHGCLGKFHITCDKPVEGVQYVCRPEVWPMWYCEEHALEQNDWDKNLYTGTYKEKPLPKGWQEEVDAMMFKIEKKKRRKQEKELEEQDPTA
jgi:hypothetical protein